MIDEKDELESKNNYDYFSDDMSVEKAENIRWTASRFLRDVMKQKWQIIIVCICLTVSAVCTILAPKVLGNIIDQIYTGIKNAMSSGKVFSVNAASIGGVLLILLSLYVISALFNYIPQRILAKVSQRVTLSLRTSISEKLNKLPLKYYDTHKKGDILSRITSDLEKISDMLQEGVAQMITSVITLIGAFVMLFSISPSLTGIVLATVAVSAVAAGIIGMKTNRCYAANQKALGELNANIEEAFTGNHVIKAFNLQDEMTRENSRLNENLRRTSIKAQFITYAINPLVRLIGHAGYIAVAVRGTISVINGTISVGDIQAAFQYVNQISEPLTEILYVWNNFQGALASAERIYQMLDEPEEIPDVTNEIMLPEPKGNVTFEHVRFGYSDDNILMDDVNIDVKAGSKIAIVGPTGAGKTTLVNLLMRFYEVQSGKILIDGVDIKSMSRSELHSVLGMVLQDTWLFNGSVAENIAYGKSDATAAQIQNAARAARIHHFICTLPDGYQTVLDDELTGISVGQKQLLTIARVILSNPSILILDEATSSVDTRTEAEIQKAMNNLMKGRTSFVIAHRLSTIQDADLILVMREGTIIEQGSHTELMRKNGFYADLYNSQFAVNVK